jgi:hypothetical protein
MKAGGGIRRYYEYKKENIFLPLVQLLMSVSGISLFYITIMRKVCVTDHFIVNIQNISTKEKQSTSSKWCYDN